MKSILVSLISDQTVPNILTIHHFKPDELLFISTNDMEKKKRCEAIIKTLAALGLNYDRRSSKILVQEDSLLDCHKKIEKWIEGRDNAEFIINLTGGTKIMAIAAYEYFKDYNSRMVYVPIPKNEFITPFPKKSPGKPTALTLRLNVVQYLTAYGLEVTNKDKLKGYRHESLYRAELSEWIAHRYDRVKNALIWLCGNLRPHRDGPEFNFEGTFSGANAHERELFQRLEIEYINGHASKRVSRSDIRYLTGGWLEEYCFNAVAEFVGKGIDDAEIGLKMKNPQGRDNEFDVMFTKGNALYFVECKSLDQHDDINVDVLYKIGALQRDFGLKVKSFLVTTSPYILKNGEIRQSVKARAEQFHTEIIPPAYVPNFKNLLVQHLSLKEFES